MKKSEKNTKSTEPIKFETVYPISIREKDGALSFNAPGDPIVFEENEVIKTAMLAHKLNEIIIELHKLQRVAFVNNALIADMKKMKGRNDGNEAATDTTQKQ